MLLTLNSMLPERQGSDGLKNGKVSVKWGFYNGMTTFNDGEQSHLS